MLLINRPKRNACEPSKEGKGWTIFFFILLIAWKSDPTLSD